MSSLLINLNETEKHKTETVKINSMVPPQDLPGAILAENL